MKELQFDMLDLDFIMEVSRILEQHFPGKSSEVLLKSDFLRRLSMESEYVYHYDEQYWADFVRKEYEAKHLVTV